MKCILLLASAMVLTGCAIEGPDPVTVSVASSLTNAFEDIASDGDIAFEINIAGSGTLVHQVIEGAPVGVIVTADRMALQSLGERVHESEILATNRLTVLRSTSGPVVERPSDLLDNSLIVSACDPSVPCGRLTEAVLAALDLPVEIDTLETNVRLVRERVASGEADIGFVYVTDVPADDPRVMEVAAFDGIEIRNEVVVSRLDDGDAARRVYDFIAAEAPEVLTHHGFEQA